MNKEYANKFETVSLTFPHVVNVLKSLVGSRLVVETVRSSDSGYLLDVKPDHLVIKNQPQDPITFILISQVVSIMVIN